MRFSQLGTTDCLVASMENLLGLPRSLFPAVESVKVHGEVYPSYRWMCDTLREHGTFKVEHGVDWRPLPPLPCTGIVGVMPFGRVICHAMYQHVNRVWDGWQSRYVEDEPWVRDALIAYRIVPAAADGLDPLYQAQDEIDRRHAHENA